MEFVVGRADLALPVDDERAVGDLAIIHQHGQRADVQPDTVARGRFASLGEHAIFILWPQGLRCAGCIAVEQAGHFRREQHLSSACRRPFDRVRQRSGIHRRVNSGVRLKKSDAGHRLKP